MKSVTSTTHRALNYGAVLQAYALQRIQLEMGIDNKILDLPSIRTLFYKTSNSSFKGKLVKSIFNIQTFFHKKDAVCIRQKFDRFISQELQTTSFYQTLDELRQNPPEADFYINGSDQVLGLRGEQSAQRMLDFGSDSMKRFSYAGSLAEYNWSDEEKRKAKTLLERFDMLSVREQYAKDYLQPFIDVLIDTHMDPVFMTSRSEFDRIAVEPDIKEPYILIFPLISNKLTQPLIDQIKKDTGYKTFCIMPSRTLHYKVDKTLYTAGPGEFIGLVKNASFVITTSFHGTAFSIIYNKPFYTLIKNFKSQRMTDLLQMLGLSERLYFPGTRLSYNVDFTAANTIMTEEKQRCRAYFEKIKRIVSGQEAPPSKSVFVSADTQNKKSIWSVVPDESNRNQRQLDNKELCFGCGACMSACSSGAIDMVADIKGFAYPIIDKQKCIGCGRCQAICDTIHNVGSEDTIQSSFALQLKDKAALRNSSSGGAFTAVTDYVLGMGGLVAGCVFDAESKLVKHILTDSPAERDKMRGSKYAQSNAFVVFQPIKAALSSGRLVLFSGTPCQNAALITFLGTHPENLITVDLLCHGVPSPLILASHLAYAEKKNKSKICDFSFRSKKFGAGQRCSAQFENGKQEVSIDLDRIYRIYPLNMRDSCYKCPFACRHRFGDITLGDYWRVDDIGWMDNRGTSALMTSSMIGEKLVEAITAHCRLVGVDSSAVRQLALSEPAKRSAMTDAFWTSFFNDGYAKTLDAYATVSTKGKCAEYLIRVLHTLRLNRLAAKFNLIIRKHR